MADAIHEAARTPGVSLIQTLLEQARQRPDAIYAQDIHGDALTYAGILSEAERWARRYAAQDVGRDQRVVTKQHNTLESLAGWLGLAWLGAIEAPINNDYRGDLLVHALNLTQARVMLVLEQFLPRVLEVVDRLEHLRRVVVIDGPDTRHPRLEILGRDRFLAEEGGAPGLRTPAPWDIMAVLFTSGTTGPSKAVRLPWAQLHAMAHGTYRLEDFGPDEVIYNSGPTYHVGAKVPA